eukprot:GHVO01023815.1.p2 GENE.GHVO01023815.1~~GHVO01023815.1.p2  ORF type:complete len:120 (+),score=9.81 GHVO01023815.1:1070-1429(+)
MARRRTRFDEYDAWLRPAVGVNIVPQNALNVTAKMTQDPKCSRVLTGLQPLSKADEVSLAGQLPNSFLDVSGCHRANVYSIKWLICCLLLPRLMQRLNDADRICSLNSTCCLCEDEKDD